jgi:flagellar biosynthesis protein
MSEQQNPGQRQQPSRAIPMPPRSTPAPRIDVSSSAAAPPKAPVPLKAPARAADGPVAPLPPRKPGEARKAVALTYDPANAAAPVVTAAGQGLVAEEIIRRAQAAGVPVTEDPRLAAVLSQIDVGAVIPPELYTVVAEVLAYVYRLDDRVNRRR